MFVVTEAGETKHEVFLTLKKCFFEPKCNQTINTALNTKKHKVEV